MRVITKDDSCKKDSPYSFELSTTERTYLFSCSLVKDRDMWVSGITEIILKYTKPLLKKSGIQIMHSNYEWDKYYQEMI